MTNILYRYANTLNLDNVYILTLYLFEVNRDIIFVKSFTTSKGGLKENSMKKAVPMLLVVFVLSAMVLAACGGGSQTGEQLPAVPADNAG